MRFVHIWTINSDIPVRTFPPHSHALLLSALSVKSALRFSETSGCQFTSVPVHNRLARSLNQWNVYRSFGLPSEPAFGFPVALLPCFCTIFFVAYNEDFMSSFLDRSHWLFAISAGSALSIPILSPPCRCSMLSVSLRSWVVDVSLPNLLARLIPSTIATIQPL
jgi:hypothetical protein